jgi:glycerol-3-phosphate dehydrogenase
LQERRHLLNNAPHLVRPQPLLYPIYRKSENSFLKLSAGMWLYDSLALFRNVRPHRMLLGRTLKKANPALRAKELVGAARFYDAQTHDARLTLANAQQAHEYGATLYSYLRLVAFIRDDQGAIVGGAFNC